MLYLLCIELAMLTAAAGGGGAVSEGGYRGCRWKVKGNVKVKGKGQSAQENRRWGEGSGVTAGAGMTKEQCMC